MNPRPAFHRALTYLFLLAFAFSLPGPLSLLPSAKAATTSSTGLVKKLKKQIATMRRQIASLKKQLAAAKVGPPTSTPFIEMVKVGNAGNAADSTTYGAVPYEYSIGKYEVTLAQYAAFLNAVAATDTYGLFNSNMATDNNIKGIAQNGASGSFSYSVIGSGTRPVTYVSWYDAARFCNWLHNGRPSGAQTAATTENGAYPLNGATNDVSIVLNRAAKFWIPSEDEWYKAAYHDPRSSSVGGPPGNDNYWLYPTRSDTVPGNEIGALPRVNHANFRTSVYSVTQNAFRDVDQNYLTAAGSYPGSAGFYGTFDQGGNVWEWNDAVISGMFRGMRGGSWVSSEGDLRSSARNNDGGLNPNFEGNFSDFGFRVASP